MVKINIFLLTSVFFVGTFGVYESKAMAAKEQATEESSFLSTWWAVAKDMWTDFNETSYKIAEADAAYMRKEQKKDEERILGVFRVLGLLKEEDESKAKENSSSQSAEVQDEKASST